MYNNSKIAKSVRFALALGVVSLSSASFAQEAAETGNEETVEKISVTGSRIMRPELSQPAPTLTLDSEQIGRFATPDLGSLLSELPAIGATNTLIGNNNSNENAGVSSVDLRRLGTERTLVLINGRRHVAGTPDSSEVDLSTVPSSLIERVEIITGGASAVYGSDAVSGVVNVILKDDFTGFEFNAAGAASTEGAGSENNSFDFLAGADFADGDGNVTLFAGVERIQETMKGDLQQFDNWGTIINPEDTGEEDGVPDRLRVRGVGSEMINRFGVINPFGPSRMTFMPDGTPMEQLVRDGTNSFAFGSFPNGGDTIFYTEDYENFQPGVKKVNIASTLNYDITDNLRFFSNVKFVRSDITQQFQPDFSFGGIAINVADNPFLDDGLRQDLLDGGQSVVGMAKFFDELGNRSADNRRELFRFVGGFKGDFTISDTYFDYELSYNYGETTNERRTLDTVVEGNLTAALDAVIDPETGNAACRSQVASMQGDGYEDPATLNGSDCAPYNPFGFGNQSQAATDFVQRTVTRDDTITQEVISGSLTFDTAEFVNLQGGPIGVALGAEYRKETSGTITDNLAKAGLLSTAATPDSYGEYDVTDTFIEVRLPILADMAFAKELTLDGAFRTASYSHAGDADAWKIGLVYAPFDDIRIRGTIGEAVRAPNIGEAFSPQTPGFANINDPCDADNIDDDPDRRGNCAALGIPDGFQANDNVSIETISGGNPNLFSETSESKTYGMVWTPSNIKNFSVTVDYYDIQIDDAVTLVDSQDILDNCVDATGSPDQNFCGKIVRGADNDIDLVRSGYINASALNTKGVEAELRYNTPLADYGMDGKAEVKFFVNKLLELEVFEFQDRPDEINVEDGEVGDPDTQFRLELNYALDDLKVNWTARYIDRVALFDVSPGGDTTEDTDISFVGSMTTHDLSANYYLNDKVSLSLGVRNLFDKTPPGYTEDALYDLVGRRIFAGIKIAIN